MEQRYQLRFPITTTFRVQGGADRQEATSEVTIRRPTAGDLRKLGAHAVEIEKELAMISYLTGLDALQVDKLDILDLKEISAIIEGFTEHGRPTGAT